MFDILNEETPRITGDDAMPFHYVYRITDTETGEYYIGKRSCAVEPEFDPYMGSGKWCYDYYSGKNGKPKFGRNFRDAPTGRFEKLILEECGSEAEAYSREAALIGDFWWSDEKCKNLVSGGIQKSFPPNDVFSFFHVKSGKRIDASRRTMQNEFGANNIASVIAGKSITSNGYSLWENRNSITRKSFPKDEIHRLIDLNTGCDHQYTVREIRDIFGMSSHALLRGDALSLHGFILYENRHLFTLGEDGIAKLIVSGFSKELRKDFRYWIKTYQVMYGNCQDYQRIYGASKPNTLVAYADGTVSVDEAFNRENGKALELRKRIGPNWRAVLEDLKSERCKTYTF